MEDLGYFCVTNTLLNEFKSESEEILEISRKDPHQSPKIRKTIEGYESVLSAITQLRSLVNLKNYHTYNQLFYSNEVVIVDSLNVGRWRDKYQILHFDNHQPKREVEKILKEKNPAFLDVYIDWVKNFETHITDPDEILQHNITMVSLLSILLNYPPTFVIVHRQSRNKVASREVSFTISSEDVVGKGLDFYKLNDEIANVKLFVMEVDGDVYGEKNYVSSIDDAAVIILYELVRNINPYLTTSIMSADKFDWYGANVDRALFRKIHQSYKLDIVKNQVKDFNCSS